MAVILPNYAQGLPASQPAQNNVKKTVKNLKTLPMNLQSNNFDASELCSRKLWQLVKKEGEPDVTADQLQEAVDELASRRHYLAELADLGKVTPESPDA